MKFSTQPLSVCRNLRDVRRIERGGQAFRVVIDLVRIPMVMPQIGADDTVLLVSG